MIEWKDGYITSIGYPFGYYTSMNPLRAKLALLDAGFSTNMLDKQNKKALELAFGQGLSVNIHAAAGSYKWYGNDFNPEQASFAQELNSVSKAGAELTDESFEELLKRSDELPMFDYIALHGVWSWISEESRNLVLKIIEKKLKVNGVLYISYNTLPGWSDFSPIRHLLLEHVKTMTAPGYGVEQSIDNSLKFANRILSANPQFALNNPVAVDHLRMFENKDRHYLAHEFYNLNWKSVYFNEMAESLENIKLNYACSAAYIEHVDNLNLTQEQQQVIYEIPDLKLRETVRDFMVNQQFRYDYWIKGGRRITRAQADEEIRKIRVILLSYPDEISLDIVNLAGKEIHLPEDIFRPVIDVMSDNNIKSIGQIEHELMGAVSFNDLKEVIFVLGGLSHIYPVQDDDDISNAEDCCERLNRYLLDKARFEEYNYLASPVIGGGFPLDRISQLILNEIISKKHFDYNGKIIKDSLVKSVYDIISAPGQTLQNMDSDIVEKEDAIMELKIAVTFFIKRYLPLLKKIRII